METKVLAAVLLIGIIAATAILSDSSITGMTSADKLLKLPHDIEVREVDQERLDQCIEEANENKERCWRILRDGCTQRYHTDIKRCRQRYA